MNPFGTNQSLKTVDDVRILAERLAAYPEIFRYDHGDHKEAWALADSFAELEKLMRLFVEIQLPKLTDKNLPLDEVPNIFFEIGENFRRLLYHMLTEAKYFRHLVNEAIPAADED